MTKSNIAYTKLDKAAAAAKEKKSPASAKNESLLVVYVRIALIVALYWVVSISMVFLNKLILSDSEYSLDAPLFICWFQCLVTLVITTSFSLLSRLLSNVAITRRFRLVRLRDDGHHHDHDAAFLHRFTWLKAFPPLDIQPHVAKEIFPLTIFFVGMVTFNNLCLKHVGVAFYFVGRSLTTVFNVVFTFVILRQATSKAAIGCCGAIVVGFFLGADQEKLLGSLSASGVLFGVLASMFVALNAIFTVNALKVVNKNIWTLTIYNNLLACLLFVPCMIVGEELPVLRANSRLLANTTFWSLMLVSGFFGFLIGYVTNLQIKYTSPLTHNISGTAKACAQTLLATYYYHESKTFSWWLSNAIVLLASSYYGRVRQREMARKRQETRGNNIDDAPSLANRKEGGRPSGNKCEEV